MSIDYVTVSCTYLAIIAIIGILHLTAFASEDSTSINSIKIESSVYYIEKNKQTIAHISGNLVDKSRQVINITITAPDLSQEFIKITSTDSGYFETLYLFDFTSQIGTYSILASTSRDPIRHIEFEVRERVITANSSNDVTTEKQYLPIHKNTLIIETDRSAYNAGDSIVISGKISNPHIDLLIDQPIILRILSSNNNIIFVDQINIDEFGVFSTSLIINGSMWSTNDTYTIMAHYGKNIGISNFTFSPSILPPSQNRIHNYIPKNDDKITILDEDISTEEKPVSTIPNNNTLNNISPTQPITSVLLSTSGSIPVPSSRSDSTIPMILLILVILIVLFIIIVFKGKYSRVISNMRLFKNNRSRRLITNQSSKEASTIAFYECPKCHDPNIRNNLDGSATCDNCGFTT